LQVPPGVYSGAQPAPNMRRAALLLGPLCLAASPSPSITPSPSPWPAAPLGTLSTLVGGASEVNAPALVPSTAGAATALLSDDAGGFYYSTSWCIRYVSRGVSNVVAGVCGATAATSNLTAAAVATTLASVPSTAAPLAGVTALAGNASGLFFCDTAGGAALLRFHSFAAGVVTVLAGNGSAFVGSASVIAPAPSREQACPQDPCRSRRASRSRGRRPARQRLALS
jgi:hypothetical protein